MNLSKDAFYNTVGNIVYLGCQWIIVVLVTRLCGYEDAGVLSVAMSSVNVFFVIAGFGMRSFQASDITHVYSDAQYLGSRFFTVFVAMLACILFTLFTGYSSKQIFAIYLFLGYKLLEAMADVIYGIWQAKGRLKSAGYSLCIKGVAGVTAFSLSLLITRELNKSLGALLISGLAILLTYDYQRVIRYKEGSLAVKTCEIKQIKKLIIQCFPMFLVSVSPMILQAIPKLLLEKMVSTEQLGIYSSVAAPTVIINTLVSSIIIPYLPLFSYYINQGKVMALKGLLLKSLGLTFLLGALGALGSLLFGRFFLNIVFGETILTYAPLLTYIIIMMTISAGLMSFNSLFIAGRKLVPLAVVYLITIVFCTIFSPYFIKLREMYGVVDVLLLVQAAQMFVLAVMSVYFFFKRTSNQRIDN